MLSSTPPLPPSIHENPTALFVLATPSEARHYLVYNNNSADGPLVVDTQPAALSDRVLAAIRGLTPRPIRHIVLTSGDDQNAGGAANLAKAGRYVRVIDSVDPRGIDTRASIIAHLNVLNRMTTAKQPSESLPTDTYFTAEWSLFSNGSRSAARFRESLPSPSART